MKTKLILLLATALSLTANAQKWTNYTMANTSNALPTNSIKAIAIDKHNIKWFGFGIGAIEGLTTLDSANNNWKTYTTYNSSLTSNSITTIACDANDKKWIGTWGAGVWTYNDTAWTNYTSTNTYYELYSDYLNVITSDVLNGKIWFGSDGGTWEVSNFDGTNWAQYNNANNNVDAIAVDDSKGEVWVGTSVGVYKFDGTHWTNYSTSNSSLLSDDVTGIAIDDKGNKWFATYGGISEFDGTNWTNYTTTNGLANNNVLSIAIDANKNKWFGTNGGGISKFDGTNWTTYNVANTCGGLVSNDIFSIAVDNDGSIWFGTFGGISVLGTGNSTLSVLPTNLNIADTANSSATFDITSNIDWHIKSNQSWLTMNDTTGLGNATIKVTASANLSDSTRIAKVIISACGVTSDTIVVTQAAGEYTGIDNVLNTAFSIYPIPVNDKMYISLSKSFTQSSITIYDITGQVIYSSKLNNSINEIDMSKFSTGVYFAKITNNSGTITKKIIKQ